MKKAIEEVSLNYVPKPGDELRFWYGAKWYIPERLETWIIRKITENKSDYILVNSVNYTPDKKYLIVDAIVVEPRTLGQLVITVAMIGATILGTALLMYFSLSKVEKVVNIPSVQEGFLNWGKILPYALLIFGAGYFIKELKH